MNGLGIQFPVGPKYDEPPAYTEPSHIKQQHKSHTEWSGANKGVRLCCKLCVQIKIVAPRAIFFAACQHVYQKNCMTSRFFFDTTYIFHLSKRGDPVYPVFLWNHRFCGPSPIDDVGCGCVRAAGTVRAGVKVLV